MQFIAPLTTDLLLDEATNDGLYLKLIEQINKDFNFANEPVDFHSSTTPYELKVQLHEKVFRLIQHKYAELLNLLYIIDVPENNVKQLDGTDTVELAEQIAYLILKREWMKVWFRAHY
ncbi:MAG: hypothetical protein RLZZ500_861 [Bacteroidota bacterium]|jgi:hypothetical protein